MTGDTELQELDSFAASLPAGMSPWEGRVDGASPYLCSSTVGIGKDNPLNAYGLTTQQKSRSVYATMEGVSSFRVRSYHEPVVLMHVHSAS